MLTPRTTSIDTRHSVVWGEPLESKEEENVLTIRERSASCEIFGGSIPGIHAPTSCNEYSE